MGKALEKPAQSFPISEPGIYGDIPMSTYHGQAWLDGPSISSSGLRTIETKSCKHFYAGWSGNPNHEPETTDALSLGSAAHALVLGDEAFEDRHVVEPWKLGRNRNEGEWIVSAKRDWVQEQAEAGKIVVRRSQLEIIEQMAEPLQRYSDVFVGDVEQSVVWKDETGRWVKSRMDVRPLSDTLADYKTTVDAHPRKCAKSIADYGYHQQFALAVEGLWKTAQQRIETCLCVFQEKTAPFEVTPVEIDPSAIEWGARQNRRALDLFDMCLRDGSWPGYYMPPTPVHLPGWMEEKLVREDKELTLPPAKWIEEMR